jgi:hypothetical protein
MNASLWAGTIALLPLLAYSLQFTAATLLLGRTLSETNSGTGFQAAISPPWETYFGLLIYGLTLAVVGASWYEFGIGRAILCVLTLFIGLSIGRRLLPKPDSLHFKALIIQSMANRYANFVRGGDHVRGDAMKMLLQKAGVDPDLLAGRTPGSVMSATMQTADKPGPGRP